ncbi:hypothetical protein [Paenibacillus alba]|uniref:Uncharacterized protein n=1 Tax=Paenibacillus alba TaxID=1197127 RepID=A0ABU6GAL0_9BACL|nr:hypothetical protein [Paenibacillus alba]MEC0231182.1 hypothetical protein [Paenibacillus alba]
MNQWPPIKSRPPIVQRVFKGINKLDPFSISPEYATDSKNITSSKYPAMTTRPGYTVLGAAIGTKVLGIGIWKDQEVHAVFNDGTWRKWTGSAWATLISSGLDTSAEWSFCNFKGNLGDFNLIATNGVNPAKRYDGTNVVDLSGAPAGINYIDEHDNRLYGVVNGVQVSYSELNVPSNWTTIAQNDSDPGSIKKEINTGKKIVGLKAGAGHVTVFFPTSTHELYGTSPSDFAFVQAASDIGMLNNKCAVNNEDLVYFFGDKGNYQYGGGSRPSKNYSAVVQWYADQVNQSAKSTSCIGTDGKNVYIALPINSGTAPDTILEYDTTNKVWNVWNDIQAVCFAKMGNKLYIGDALGRVLQVGGTTDNGQPIVCRRVSIPYSAASMQQIVQWIRASISSNIATGSSVNIYLSGQPEGDSDWVLASTVTATNNLNSVTIQIPTTYVANAHFIRVKLEWTGQVDVREFSYLDHQKPWR